MRLDLSAMRRTLYSIFLSSLIATAAFAQPSPVTLEVIAGQVYVDQGHGLTRADRFTLLGAQDRVLVKAGGTALLFNSKKGCTISLREAGLYRLPDMSNCQSGQATVLTSAVVISPANGVFVPAQPVLMEQAVSQSGVMLGLGFGAAVGMIGFYEVFVQESPVSKL